MEKVIEIFSKFFDIEQISLRRLIAALIIFALFYLLRGFLSSFIIKLFKIKDKEKIKKNNFYKPLRIFFASLGLYCFIMLLGPTETLSSIVSKLFRLTIIVLCTYSLGNLVAPYSHFEKGLKKKINKANDSMIHMICKTIKAIVYIIGGIIFISELGYNITGIIAGLGIGGVAIALAAQDTASNIIGAAMIILDKPFDVGDWVCIDTTEGSVEEFTFRSTRIRQSQNSIVSIPNSTVVNSAITNWSRLQKRRIMMDLVLEFSTPLKKVADVQNDILIHLENESNIITESIYVKFTSIADNGYNLKLFCYTPILNYVEYLSFMNDLNFKIMEILNKNKVNLAYDSKTIYLKNINKA